MRKSYEVDYKDYQKRYLKDRIQAIRGEILGFLGKKHYQISEETGDFNFFCVSDRFNYLLKLVGTFNPTQKYISAMPDMFMLVRKPCLITPHEIQILIRQFNRILVPIEGVPPVRKDLQNIIEEVSYELNLLASDLILMDKIQAIRKQIQNFLLVTPLSTQARRELRAIIGHYSLNNNNEEQELSLLDLVTGNEEINTDNIEALVDKFQKLSLSNLNSHSNLRNLVLSVQKSLDLISSEIEISDEDYSDSEDSDDSDDEEMLAQLANI